MAESSYAGAGISVASQSGMTGGSSSPAVNESKKSAGRRRLASDYVSAGIFALVLLCWFVLPFLQVTEKATGAIQNSGSALAYLTGGAGKTENGSPATLAAAAAVCAAAGLALSLFRGKIFLGLPNFMPLAFAAGVFRPERTAGGNRLLPDCCRIFCLHCRQSCGGAAAALDGRGVSASVLLHHALYGGCRTDAARDNLVRPYDDRRKGVLVLPCAARRQKPDPAAF